jgi:2-methylisocitrate lyase-like PEP mutase family enzyme
LRRLLAEPEVLVLPGVYDALSASLAQRSGFRGAYMTGAGVSMALIGHPDLGFTTMTEMAGQVARLTAVLTVPLVADADTGYGNALSVQRTVTEYQRAGAAGLHIEDQTFPKRCGHLTGKSVIDRNEFVEKIRAAAEARTDPDLVIIARTDAGRTHDIDEALRRAEAYGKAGADMLFVYSHNPDELRRIGERLPPPLMMFAPADGLARFPLSARDLAGLGFRIAAAPVPAYAAMHKAVRQSFAALARGEPDPLLGPGGAAAEMKLAQGTAELEKLLEIERRTTERR